MTAGVIILFLPTSALFQEVNILRFPEATPTQLTTFLSFNIYNLSCYPNQTWVTPWNKGSILRDYFWSYWWSNRRRVNILFLSSSPSYSRLSGGEGFKISLYRITFLSSLQNAQKHPSGKCRTKVTIRCNWIWFRIMGVSCSEGWMDSNVDIIAHIAVHHVIWKVARCSDGILFLIF